MVLLLNKKYCHLFRVKIWHLKYNCCLKRPLKWIQNHVSVVIIWTNTMRSHVILYCDIYKKKIF